MFKSKIKVTNCDGFLDGFLAKARSRVADRFISSAHRRGRILDVGCGVWPLFLINTEFWEKYAIDRVSQESDSRFFKNQKIKLINGDVEKLKSLPFDAGYFDVVTMLAVLEHIKPEKLKNILSEIYRVLKHEGLFIITTPAAWTGTLLNAMALLKLVSPIGMKEHKDRYTPSKVSILFQKAGFSKEKIMFGYFEAFMNIWIKAAK